MAENAGLMESLYRGALKLGISLTPLQLQSFENYYHDLIDWNQKINLTSITGYEEVQTKHFLDSLTVLAAFKPEFLEKPIRLIDIGTGAGLPGIPLKIVNPQLQLVLLEATNKKTKFLEHVVSIIDLKDVKILSGRAEDIAHEAPYREKFDVVVSRAVAALPALVELSLPFCAIGGCFIAQKKGNIREEINLSAKAIEVLGGRLREEKRVDLEELPDDRVLVIIDKIKAAPSAYPRRPGMPVKRPIAPGRTT